MAKTSAIQRNLKRIKLVKKFLKKRESLKKIIKNKKLKNKLLDYIESYNIFLELRMPQRFRAKTSTLSYLKVFFMKIYFPLLLFCQHHKHS